MDCRIRLVQFEPTLGNVAANLAAHLSEVQAAIEDGVEFVLFPELSVTGYFLKDQVPEVGLRLDAPELQPLAKLSREITIAVGLVERARDGRLYNSSVVFEEGRIAHVHRKVHLVSYGMFEEMRDLAAGETFDVFESKHGRFGFLICEDMWHVDGAYLYFLQAVDAILVLSASPGRGVTAKDPDSEAPIARRQAEGSELGSMGVWRTLQDALALYFRTWIVYAGRVGWEDGIVFAGGTRVVGPAGQEVAALDGLDAGRLDARLSGAELERSRMRTPLLRDERPWILARGLAQHLGYSTAPPPDAAPAPGQEREGGPTR